MHPSNESELKTPVIKFKQNGPFLVSPILQNLGTETPPSIPAAPHPSPINMDMAQPDPEFFRTKLLKACQRKIPEIADSPTNYAGFERMSITENYSRESKLNDQFKKQSLNESTSPCPVLEGSGVNGLQACITAGQKYVVGQSESTKLFTSNLNYACEYMKDKLGVLPQIAYSNDQDADCLIRLGDDGLEQDSSSNLRFYKAANGKVCGLKRQSSLSLHDRRTSATEDYSNYLDGAFFESVPESDLSRTFRDMEDKNGLMLYNHATSSLGMPDVSCSWGDCSSFHSRSPCSDRLSTTAICASDASDISDMELAEDPEEKIVESSKNDCKAKEKKSGLKSSAVRRFLSWRRSLKSRKRAASLDEGRFPNLVKSLDSYKTEFELSV